MFIFEFLSDANFGLASFTILIYSIISYNNRIDRFKIGMETGQIGLRLFYNTIFDLPLSPIVKLFSTKGSVQWW